jgi:hypothetical protein
VDSLAPPGQKLKGDIGIGPIVQVRGTEIPHGGLIARVTDEDHHPIYLVLAHNHPEYRIIGQMPAGVAKTIGAWHHDWYPAGWLVTQQDVLAYGKRLAA